MPAIRDPIYFHDNPDVITIPASPLDDLLPDQRFDVVIMDIEGSEHQAL